MPEQVGGFDWFSHFLKVAPFLKKFIKTKKNFNLILNLMTKSDFKFINNFFYNIFSNFFLNLKFSRLSVRGLFKVFGANSPLQGFNVFFFLAAFYVCCVTIATRQRYGFVSKPLAATLFRFLC